MHQVFDNLYSMGLYQFFKFSIIDSKKYFFSKLGFFFFPALRYSTNDGEFKDNALRLTNSLINIR